MGSKGSAPFWLHRLDKYKLSTACLSINRKRRQQNV
jgi:hypothetical protein